jgi:hypothetical protein
MYALKKYNMSVRRYTILERIRSFIDRSACKSNKPYPASELTAVVHNTTILAYMHKCSSCNETIYCDGEGVWRHYGGSTIGPRATLFYYHD